MTSKKPTNLLQEFFQEFIDELEKYWKESKKSDPPPTPRTEPTAFQEFTQELRDNWKTHPLRTTTLDLVKAMRNTKTKLAEAMKKIKKNKKKFKLHKS